MTVGTGAQAANMAAHIWFHTETYPSFEDIVANVRQLNSRLNISSIVINNIYEFDNKEDYEAFSGKKVKDAAYSPKVAISAATAHAKMNPKKEDFTNHDEVYEKIEENADSTIGVLGYLLDEDGLWKQLQLDWMIDHYEKKLEYEKCAYVRDIKKKNFYEAPPIMQGILNEQMAIATGGQNERL